MIKYFLASFLCFFSSSFAEYKFIYLGTYSIVEEDDQRYFLIFYDEHVIKVKEFEHWKQCWCIDMNNN